MTTTTTTAPADRIDLTVHARVNDEMRRVPVTGKVVAPGLAIVTALFEGQPVPSRWTLAHIPSGKRLGWTEMCCRHVLHAKRMAVASGVDWTRDEATVKADRAAKQVAQTILSRVGPCDECPSKVVRDA